MSIPPRCQVEIRRRPPPALGEGLPRWESYLLHGNAVPLSRHPGWLRVLERGLGYTPYCLEAVDGDKIVGLLPLSLVRGPIFGRFLVGLPYLNSGGVSADDESVARMLISAAARLADDLEVHYLELRHERVHEHPRLNQVVRAKVHMRLKLPATADELWLAFPAKVRNQIRKAELHGLQAEWGELELLPEFYRIFSRNMRDLGTPVYGPELFR